MESKKKHLLFICTEDWFFESHFLPLNEAALKDPTTTTSLLCQTGSKTAQTRRNLTERGLKLYPLHFDRQKTGALAAFVLLWRLWRHLKTQQPDIIHFIALKPVLLGGLAAFSCPKSQKIYHVTGMGSLAEGTSLPIRLARQIAFRLVPFYIRRRHSHLLIENPDDLAFLQSYGDIPATDTTLLGGAGIDPEHFTPLPPPDHNKPHIAYIGRMIWTKGVDVLVQACKILAARNIAFHLDLYGDPDIGNPKSVTRQTIEDWQNQPYISWHGHINDVRKVWEKASIAVVPTRTREGMPRAMLEAAACARPLIVTDIPGCRHFVRNGRDGLIVAPEDADALANALEKLIKNAALCKTMGQSARGRVLQGYTEQDIQNKMTKIYHGSYTNVNKG